MSPDRPLHATVSADDLLILLAVARSGTVTGAASRLGVDHSTVSRHVARMEKRVGRRLFDRSMSGWQLTETGRRLRRIGERIQHDLDEAERAVARDDEDSIRGPVRLLTPDAFGTYLAPRALAPALARHRSLRIELLTSTRHVDLRAGEYDIAVSLEPPPSRAVVATRLCTYSLALFASADYLADHAPITSVDDLRDHPVVYYLDECLDIAPLRVLDDLIPGVCASVQSNSVGAQIQAVLAGHGVGLLPAYATAFHDGLVPVLPAEVDVGGRYWVVVPSAVRRAPHIRAVVDALTSRLAGHLEPTTVCNPAPTTQGSPRTDVLL
ncbi:LysR family transcriptional regulator [Gordonia desulfuricans]|uniref:LysR family transcriptional regulator n=1 Tax=Gordonia desulfuricans TaxID=89051 RepID=A0A7K3LMX5_9ACTN|nr:LysR family transcriptional regulator [Gordonia desulfuricans]NDK89538.1 LysR family transcriptional regulator [Gordonia desulfuricans]